MVGYYLHAERTHVHCIQTLHALGVSTSCVQIRRCEKANSAASLIAIRQRVKTEPFLLSWDNINRLVRISHENLHSKSFMINWTSAAIIFLKDIDMNYLGGKSGLPIEWVGEDKLRKRLRGIDFMLDQEALEYHGPMCRASIGNVLYKYFRRQVTEKRIYQGQLIQWWPEVVPQKRVLKVERSDAHVLPTMELNEGTIDGTIQVMEEVLKVLEIQEAQLKGCRILCSGDQLSTKLLRTSRFLRNEEEQGKDLNWTLPILGLFHLRMAILHMILR